MPEEKYILIDCKCGRKIRAPAAELNKGIICPRCGSHIVKDSQEIEKAIAEGEENTPEEIPSDALFEKCPSCLSNVRIVYRKKYLANCQSCSKFFIRQKNPEIGAAGPEENSSGKTEQFVNPINGEIISPGKNNSPIEAQPPPSATESVPSPDTVQQASTQDGQQLIPPSEKQMKILTSLGIYGTPETSQEASSIILTVTRILEDAVREYNISFHLFPNELKSAVTTKIAHSEFFSRIYYGEESMKYEELQPFLDEVIRDSELQKALKTYINNENFASACEYIRGFAECLFDIPLDPEVVKIIALKAFARGFGLKLKPFDSVIYTNAGDTIKKLNKSDQKNLMAFYTKQNKINHSLEKLFTDSGFSRPEPEKPRTGCLFFIAAAAVSIWTAIQIFSR